MNVEGVGLAVVLDLLDSSQKHREQICALVCFNGFDQELVPNCRG
jgi:Mg-chelatase subunit ChlD